MRPGPDHKAGEMGLLDAGSVAMHRSLVVLPCEAGKAEQWTALTPDTHGQHLDTLQHRAQAQWAPWTLASRVLQVLKPPSQGHRMWTQHCGPECCSFVGHYKN